jgi:hypothetical protein
MGVGPAFQPTGFFPVSKIHMGERLIVQPLMEVYESHGFIQ